MAVVVDLLREEWKPDRAAVRLPLTAKGNRTACHPPGFEPRHRPTSRIIAGIVQFMR